MESRPVAGAGLEVEVVEINLLRRYPRAKRNLAKRAEAQSPENIAISRQYGREYFDGTRDTGYGGYRYDGRWLPIAKDIAAHFNLEPGMCVLDVGAAKAFPGKDLMKACPGLEAFGLDISEYAVMHCEPEMVGRLRGKTAIDPYRVLPAERAAAAGLIHYVLGAPSRIPRAAERSRG